MENAREELEELLKKLGVHMKAAEISLRGCRLRPGDWKWNGYYDFHRFATLSVAEALNPEEVERFLESIDMPYDSGYGRQELNGIVWLTDGTWLSRGEYDGSEWWEHNKLPEIPEHLR